MQSAANPSATYCSWRLLIASSNSLRYDTESIQVSVYWASDDVNKSFTFQGTRVVRSLVNQTLLSAQGLIACSISAPRGAYTASDKALRGN